MKPGRDVVVTPWPPSGWAVLKVGNKRPGRVRASKEDAIRDGQGYATIERSRLFVSEVEVDFERLRVLHESGEIDHAGTGLGPPLVDLRQRPRRLDVRRDKEARATAVDPNAKFRQKPSDKR